MLYAAAMADLDAYYRRYLIDELARRRAKNRRYSLRAFARALGVDGGFLSRLLAGKALLAIEKADRLSRRLRLLDDARREFLLSAAEEQKCHALYLLDPTLTECAPEQDAINRSPQRAPESIG